MGLTVRTNAFVQRSGGRALGRGCVLWAMKEETVARDEVAARQKPTVHVCVRRSNAFLKIICTGGLYSLMHMHRACELARAVRAHTPESVRRSYPPELD